MVRSSWFARKRKKTTPPVPPVSATPTQEEEESVEEDAAAYELNADLKLSDAHLDILQVDLSWTRSGVFFHNILF